MMGKIIRVRYQPEGGLERELEVSSLRILGILAVMVVAFLYAASTVIGGLIDSFIAEPKLIAADIGSKIESKDDLTPDQDVLPATVQPPLEVVAEETPKEPRQVAVSIPDDVIEFVDIQDVRMVNDSDNMSVHYDILNKSGPFVKGYTYGLAKYVDQEGHEEIVASHPGIDTEHPFDRERLVTGLSYSARNFTAKTINFSRPAAEGVFSAAWIVVSRGKEVYVKEVSINE